MAIERAGVCAGLLHMGQQVAERSQLLAVGRGRDHRVEVGEKFRVVVERGLVNRKHAGRVADAEVPLAGEPEGDPAGGRRDVGHLGGLVGLVADRPEPAGARDSLRHLHTELVGKLVTLGLVAAVAPESRGGKRAAEFVSEHLAMHLARDADRLHVHLYTRSGELLSQVGHGRGQRLLPVARVLLVAVGGEAGHHCIGALSVGEDFQCLVAEDDGKSLRAGIDAEIALDVHAISFSVFIPFSTIVAHLVGRDGQTG